MSSDALAKPSVSHMDTVKELFLNPRGLLEGITGEEAQWRQSVLLAVGAVLCNSVVDLIVNGKPGDSVVLAFYVALVLVVYTGLIHFFGRWLLQAEDAPLRATSTAVNYAAILAALISVPYVGVAALLFFLYLLFLIIVVRFGASNGRAAVTLGLFLMSALVFEAFLSLFGAFD